MINEEKVALMTRMAAYEAGEGKKDAAICSYFRNEYVGFQVIKTWIGATLAVGILAAVGIVYRMDALMESFYGLDLDGIFELAKKILWAYALFCGAYMLVVYISAHVVYARAHKAMSRFHKELGALEGHVKRAEEEDE